MRIGVPKEIKKLEFRVAMTAEGVREAVRAGHSVLVDQGGCAETTVPRTHDDPVYTIDGVQHYTVANMPGAYPRTSTFALTNATLPWVLRLAALGADKAVAEFTPLRKALNLQAGKVMNAAVAAAQDL